MSTYEPGTVAVATVRGVKGVRVMRDTEGDWATAQPVDYEWTFRSGDVTDVRPLVVIDLGDYDNRAVTYLRNIARDDRAYDGDPTPRAKLVNLIADQIEAQTKPRVAEPQRCGAMVIAAQKGEDEGSERGWVRFRHGKTKCWIDSLEHVRSWDDLDNPVLQECEVQS